jgi:PAS domain S-box-containing protein
MRVILLTSGASLLLTCAAFFTYEYITFRQNTVRQISTLGEIIATNSTGALAFFNEDDAAETLASLKAEKHIVAAYLFDNNGKVYATYPANLSASELPQTRKGQGYQFNDGYLQGYQPVVREGMPLGYVYLKMDLHGIYSRFRLYGFIALLVIATSALLTYFLSKRFQRSITTPIFNLAETARIISAEQNYSIRAKKYGNDELGLLTDAFNQMLTRIEDQNDEIISLNHGLEKKVLQRTAQLKTANTILKQQNDFVETIIDSSVHVIVVVDEEMRFSTINKKGEELYSVTREEVLGKKYADVFPQARNSAAYHDIERALKGEYVHNRVTTSTVINGYFENYFIPLLEGGKVYGALILLHDITSLIESNERLKAVNAELEKSNHDLEQFAYVASHDLQEPLRKIQTFSELAERNFKNPEIAKRYFDKINASARRMAELIKAVLKYSLLSKTQEAESVDLNAIIESVNADLELVIAEKNAAINVSPLPEIQGIPLQLTQLFLNLVSNGLKFSTEQPVINIHAKLVGKDYLQQHQIPLQGTGYVQITVADNGIGFDQQHAAKIFDIFQRLHSGPAYAGTGIGLALCKKIVDNHSGFITVNSESGKGTSFIIYLPTGNLPETSNGKAENTPATNVSSGSN